MRLKRDFQKNKDWNIVKLLSKYIFSPVEAGLPEKQGLKHIDTDLFQLSDFWLKRDFQKNKDWNAILTPPISLYSHVEAGLPEKQGLKPRLKAYKADTRLRWSGTSRETRIETKKWTTK